MPPELVVWTRLTYASIYLTSAFVLGFLIWGVFAVRLQKEHIGTFLNEPTAIETEHIITAQNLELDRAETLMADRQRIIDRVRAFFIRYGSPLEPYVEIMVDKSYECGGNYRVLVGIAGSESGLGRIPYKKYNPYGYLNNVQYESWEQALTELSCKVSEQHIAKCGEDLVCLVRRYAGPQDDANLFMNKVRWFMQQV